MMNVQAMESDWKHGRQGASESQRPTIERLVANDFVEFEPSLSDVPYVPDVPDEAAVSLESLAALPLEFGVRYTVELLRALAPFHTDLRAAPAQRVYGCVAIVNTRVNTDGTVRWLPQSLAASSPHAWLAPEVHTGQAADQQCDIFAIGMLLLELVCSAARNGSAESDALTGRLLQVAHKATAPDPEARWQSAVEFAEELVRATGPRLPAAAAFAMLLRDRMPGTALILPIGPVSQALMRVPSLDSLQPEVISQRQGMALRSFSPATTDHPPEGFATSAVRRLVSWRSSLVALATILIGLGAWSLLRASPTELAATLSAEAPVPPPELPMHQPGSEPIAANAGQAPAQAPGVPSPIPKPTENIRPMAPAQKSAPAESTYKREKVTKKASPRRAAVYDPEGI
jgi:hypothetical protein